MKDISMAASSTKDRIQGIVDALTKNAGEDHSVRLDAPGNNDKIDQYKLLPDGSHCLLYVSDASCELLGLEPQDITEGDGNILSVTGAEGTPPRNEGSP
jgi:hypothetical protein